MLANLDIPSSSNVFQRELQESVFEENLDATGLRPATRRLVAEAEPCGRIVHTHDGTPLLEVRGAVLDAPQLPPRSSDNEGVIVVFGLGLGHIVRALRSATQLPIVVYEPEPGIVRTVLEHGPTDLGDVEIVCSLQELGSLWPTFTRGKPRATIVRTSGYAEAFPEDHQKLVEVINDLVIRLTMNVNTYRLRSRVWIQDVLDNIDALHQAPLFQALTNVYAGVPAFIVGAGPSLGKNGKLLAEAAKKGIVIAVNSSGRALASYGVEPQVLACMESIDVSHLISDLPYIDRVVRAFSLTASPKTLATGKGPLLPIYESLPELASQLELLTGSPGLQVCGSISTVAFSLAVRLGCSPIVLVGQDLAYTDGKAYAKGTPYENSRVRVSDTDSTLHLDWCDVVNDTHARAGSRIRTHEPLQELAAWGGEGTVWSGASFTPMRHWFGNAAAWLARMSPEVRLVNATEGGAHVEGFDELTLEQVLAPLPELGITSASIVSDAARAKAPLSHDEICAWLDGQRAIALRIAKSAARLRKLAGKGIAAVGRGNPQKIQRAFDALGAEELELRQATQASRIVEAWCYSELEARSSSGTENASTGDAEADALGGMRAEAEVAKIIEDSARELAAALVQVAQRLRAKN